MSGAMIAAIIILAVALLAGVPAVFAFFSAVLIITLAGGADAAELTSYGFLETGSIVLLAIPLMIIVKIIMKRCGVVEMAGGYAKTRIMARLEDKEDTSGIWKTFVSNVSMAGVIIPPGIAMLLYAFAGGQSIAACFAAGIVPSVILLCLFVLVARIMANMKLKALEKAEEDAEAAAEMKIAEAEEDMGIVEAAVAENETVEAMEAADAADSDDADAEEENGEDDEYESEDDEDDEYEDDEDDEEDDEDEDDERSILPAAIAPVLILIGTFSGMITLMEAAAVAVIYIVIVGWFFYQELDMEDLKDVLIEAGRKAGNLLLTLFAAMILSRFLIMEGVPQIMADGLSSMSESRGVVIIFLVLLMIIAGLLTDRNSAILLVTPVIVQVAIFAGINPIQFAVIAGLSIGMGCMIISRPAKTNLLFILLAWLPTLLLTAYIPQISLFLPMILGYL